MKKTPKYVKEVQQILSNINDNGEDDTGGYDATPPENEIDMYVEEDRITLIPRRLHGIPLNDQDIIDSLPFIDSVIEDLDTTPLPPKPKIQPISYKEAGILQFGILLSLFCFMSIVFQFYLIINPYTVTLSLLAKSQQVTLTGMLNLGRMLNPITLSQSVTANTTGKGHQDARSATGYITFYNASFSSQTVSAGTTLTGADGVQVITDSTVTIPADNPPVNGQASVSAHAINKGIAGNIEALDINGTVSSSLFVKNLNAFTGGQDERNFQTVVKSDIESAAAPLKSDLAASVQAALQGQLKQGEELQNLPCSPSTTTDHKIGQEASSVKVTMSETCSGIAYNGDVLQAKVTKLLTGQVVRKLGSGYSLLNNPDVSIIQASVNSNPPTVSLSFKAQSSWVYAMSSIEQKHIKNMIAGKSKDTAVQVLASLPDIESVSMESQGFGDNTMMPKHIENIRLAIIYL